MAQNDPTSVSAAFEMLLEELASETNFQDQLGTKAFEKHDYDAAHKAADFATQIAHLREKVTSLQNEWDALLLSHPLRNEDIQLSTQRRDQGRLPRGEAMPQSAYQQPILQVLVEMGGSGRMSDVLTRVEQIMKGRLKPVDYEQLPSDGMQRWSKSAQWARNRMAREGLLKSNSPRGIWEISEAGRNALNKNM